ncbi:hypothetical protein PSQ19_07685 [Devosia algicola]|uniref:Nuclear transport factor 2 family protein n=1 Tax=Devosia algicola TaxID=3026418 RepID=A0ABY7YRU8_9HYPH|nr:hypothetical protein [Devosia algicola]WDR03902.1 hypothetical protein PSQ19_07685 [Devosia algicola]
MPDLEQNKASAVAFCQLMFNDCMPREAIERYTGADYIQHNPHVATGKDGFITISNICRKNGRVSASR